MGVARGAGPLLTIVTSDTESGHGAPLRTVPERLSRGCCVPTWRAPAPQDPGDMSQMTDLVPWVRNVAPADDGLHTPLSGLFWWAWNSNSGAVPAVCSAL